GSSFWKLNPDYKQAFLNLIKQYPNTIVGLLASHTHSEEFKIIQDGSKNLFGVYFTAALSTYHSNEPSVKTFYFADNNGKWSLSDYETFHFSQPKVPGDLTFSKLYDFSSYYCNGVMKGDLLSCFTALTPDQIKSKMKNYFNAGNPNAPAAMGS